VVGFARIAPGDEDFALARYLPDGSLDAGFGGDGKVTTDFFGASDQIDELSIYRQALTTAQIKKIYRAGAGGKCKP